MSIEQGEAVPAPQGSIEALRQARYSVAERVALSEQKRVLGFADAHSRSFPVLAACREGLPAYEWVVTAKTLFVMDALGIDSVSLREHLKGGSNGPAAIAIMDFGTQRLVVSVQDPQDITYALHTSEEERNRAAQSEGEAAAAVQAKIQQRLQKSPAHQALAAAKAAYAGAGTLPESVATEAFDYREDPLGTLLFLSDIGLVNEASDTSCNWRLGRELPLMLDEYLQEVPLSTAGRLQQGGRTLFTWGTGVKKELEIDSRQGTSTFRMTRRPIDMYLESTASNQTHKSLPFIETECAEQLMGALDKAGLMFHPALQLEMIQDQQANGNGGFYTRLTRQIAKWINDPSKLRLSDMLVPHKPELSGLELANDPYAGLGAYSSFMSLEQKEELETQARACYEKVDRTIPSAAAAVLFQMIDGVFARTKQPPESWPSDLPVTREQVSMVHGACFNALSYYVQAALSPGKLASMVYGGVVMLEKTLGAHSFLSGEPLIFNGVRLPKGALFSKAEGRGKDQGWYLQRLTPFAFNEAADQIVFGSEIGAVAQLTQQLGELSIKALVKPMTLEQILMLQGNNEG